MATLTTAVHMFCLAIRTSVCFSATTVALSTAGLRAVGSQPLTADQTDVRRQPLTSVQTDVRSQPLTTEQRAVESQPLTTQQKAAVSQFLTAGQRDVGRQPLTARQGAVVNQPLTAEQRNVGTQPLTAEQGDVGSQTPTTGQIDVGNHSLPSGQRDEGRHPKTAGQRNLESQPLTGGQITVVSQPLTLRAARGKESASSPSTHGQSQSGKGSAYSPRTSASSPCFRDESIPCACRGSTADCSHTRLSYIPAFPRKITTLIFSFNNLTSISTGTFFHNVTGLTSLDMSRNEIESIHPEAFQRLTQLQVLDVSSNHLNYSSLSAVFAAGDVRQLCVRNLQLGPLPHGYFRRTPTIRLTFLDLSENPIKHLNLSVLAPLQALADLNCSNSQLITTTSTEQLPRLENMKLHYNYLRDFPDSWRNGVPSFPRLQRIDFAGNSFSEFPLSDIYFPELVELDLSRNRIFKVKQDMFNGQRFPKLTKLSLLSSPVIHTLEQFAFRNPSLQLLTLMYCDITFMDDHIHPDCFAGMPRLRELQVSHNLFSGVPDQKLNRLFASVTSVEKLYFGSCNLQTLRSNPFAKLTRLRKLNLYENMFSEIPDGAFDLHRNLTDLAFDNCMLRTVRSSTFNAATRKRLHRLDFGGNPLLCDCDLLWFKDWFDSSPKLFKHSYTKYACANLNKTLLKTFSLNEQVCFFSQNTYKFLISSISLFVVVLSVACTCYPYRWHVRLVLYEAFRGREGEAQRRRRLETGRFDYDVFVSYAHGDLAWVRDHLMPELEGSLGLRLCVHDRDFIPGRNIVDNIVESVGASKKVLMLFSREFVASHWCQFELNLCLSHVMEHDDVLLVTCLGDVTAFDVTKAMLAVLKVTTYIQWEDSAAARASFWGRLRLALGDVLP